MPGNVLHNASHAAICQSLEGGACKVCDLFGLSSESPVADHIMRAWHRQVDHGGAVRVDRH